MSQLFRSEAVEAKRDAGLGRILLIRPTSFATLTAVAVGCALLVVAFLLFGGYTQRARVAGVLVPDKGLIRVVSPSQGVIVERRVREGQTVRAGDVLFVLNTERQVAGVDKAVNANEAILDTLQQRKASLRQELESQATLTEKQRRQLQERLRDMKDAQAKIGQQLATQRERVAITQRQVERMRKLIKQQYYSEAALDQRADDLLAQRGRLQEMEQSAMQQSREVANVQAELDQLDVKSSRERQALDRALAEVDQSGITAQAQRGLLITAPANGVVSAVLAEAGSAVAVQTLATVLPEDAELEAQLFAPSSAAGFVQPGQKVMLRYAAYPYQKFGQYEGEVQTVSRSSLTPQELQEAAAGTAAAAGREGLYRIRVKLARQSVDVYGKAQRLTAGMQIDADIMQDRRRLIEWVFEPVLSLKGSV